MMILKKKEIIAASLVVLIGMAGYLNWSYQDTVRVRDNESYVETGKTLGEAEMVSSNNGVAEETPAAAEGMPEAAETSGEAEEAPGEAAETSGGAESAETAETGTDPGQTRYFEEAKMNRESARAAATEMLKATSSDSSVDEATRALAGEKLVACAADIELENQIESIASAKGYSEVCAYINEGMATLAVKSGGLDGEDISKLTDIVTGCSTITADNVKIVEVQ